MFVSASTHCFADTSLELACHQIADLEYDKVELWLSESTDHLKPSQIAAEPERFYARYREATRLTPVALCLQEDTDPETLSGVSQFAKLLRVTQITVPASPVGTPFNTEVDRLRSFVETTSREGVRLSIKTKAGQLTEDPNTAVELCQSVGGLGLTLDPSYYICGPNRGRDFDQVYSHVYHVHLRDTTAERLQVPVGLGQVEYNRLINQLRREGYSLYLSVELLPELISQEDRPLEMRKLRMLLDTLL